MNESCVYFFLIVVVLLVRIYLIVLESSPNAADI